MSVPTVTAPQFPAGVSGWDYLADCYHSGWRAPVAYGCSRTHPCGRCGGCYRRWATLLNPTAFAVTYLSHLLRRYPGPDGPALSFCGLHLDMAEIGRSWAVPGAHRDILAGPRDSAKSMWWLILAVWALAHGHRRGVLALARTREQVIVQLADAREAFTSALLIGDFPELAPRRGDGHRNTATYVTSTGATLVGRGLGESVLGLRALGGHRPDLIIWDDGEPEATVHTPRHKIELLRKLTSTILPMSLDAAVLMVGTPTMPGSLIHDGVRAAYGRAGLLPDRGEWVAAQGFTAHHWPALLREGRPGERSLWPQKWPTARLRALRRADPVGFALNYRCDPTQESAARLWSPGPVSAGGSYRYAPDWPITRRVLSVDGAVTRHSTSDTTALVVAGIGPDPRRVVIEHAEADRITGMELRERVCHYARLYPRTLSSVVIEVNQGGDLWREVLAPLPDRLDVVSYRNGGRKRSRIEALHRRYASGAVLHAVPLPALEDEQCSWAPDDARATDDLLDAASGAVRHLLDGDPADLPRRHR